MTTYLSGERVQGILGADIAATSTTDYVNDNAGTLHTDSIGGYKDYIGVQVLTGHDAVGEIFSSFTFWAWADQSPDGKIGVQIVTPPASGTTLGTVKGTSVTTVEANTITTSTSGTSMTFTAPLDSSGDAIELEDGDIVTLYDVEGTINTADGGQIQPVMGNTAISYQQKMAWYSGGGSAGWATYSTKSFKWKGTKITALIPAVDEKATITDVPVGTRYEETDTRKIFRGKAGGLGGCIAYYPMNNSWDNYATTGNGFPDGIGSDGDLTAQASAGFDGSTKKLGSHAGQFPADADYAKTTEAEGANFNFTGDFSVTVWFYRDDGLDGGYHAMVSKREGGNSEMNFIVGTDSTLSCYINNTAVSGTNFASTQTFANATWYHAACTRSGDTLKYYIDGVHTTTGTIGSGHSATNTAPFAIGAISGSGGEGFDGNLDDVSVWNRALSDAEITSIYNSGTGNAIPDATFPNVYWVEKGTA